MPRMRPVVCVAASCVVASAMAAAYEPPLAEWKVKREGPARAGRAGGPEAPRAFEFAQKPAVTREGDRVTIAFETQGFCDVTMAVEDPDGRIVRHLASGVLGPTAPEPFQKNSKKQAIVWDGKDDCGRYVDEKDNLTIRVSLGLKPQFERTLFWSPKKRISPGNVPNFAAAPEGVYIHEGGGVDHIRLFTHAGEYVRTVYPFPPDRSLPGAMEGPAALKAALSKVQGLSWMTFPQDGLVLPVWRGLVQATLFTSGNNTGDGTLAKYGRAASAMAVQRDRLALVMLSLNRLATDGTTGGMPLEGPKVSYPGVARQPGEPPRDIQIGPNSAAFSPDGKWLYLAGYRWLHGVARMDYLGDKPPEVFLGQMTQAGAGDDNRHFRCPTAVAVDAQGRVYVADYMNDRIQVFTPDGALFKTVAPVSKPATIDVDPRTGHMYVASWMLVNPFVKDDLRNPSFTHYGPVEDPKKIASYPLPLVNHHPAVFMNKTGGLQHGAFMDFHTDPPTIWIVPGAGDITDKLSQLRASYTGQYHRSPWMATHYQLYQEQSGKLVKKADFAQDVAKAVVRVDPPQAPAGDRQRLYVDPASGDLYVAEGDSGVGKAFRELLKIDPATGRISRVALPFTTEDMAIDLAGQVYLRTDRQVSRFRLSNWSEVPWDYGGEWDSPGFDGGGPMLAGAVPLPGTGRPGCFHLGGFGVSPDGCVVVSCYNVKPLDIRVSGAFDRAFASGQAYTPTQYPGRLRWAEVHVWDDRGRILHEDAVKGLPMTDGLAMDKDHNIYALVAANRMAGGEEYPLERAETLMKFKSKNGRILTGKRDVPVPLGDGPKRPVDITKAFAGPAWVEGQEWMYGGVGFGGFNSAKGGGGCSCWNARFALDLFGRSFVTELNRFCVAILDTNGNLIMRVGTYGNVDDGVPLVKEDGPANPRSVGGDEVALCHPSYVATHTDRRIFIADYGNYRILSVKLGYHTTERVALKGVLDQGK